MKSSRSISNSERLQTLQNLLAHQRNEALARIRDFRRAQAEDAEPLPGDELDAARALAEVETHAGLIERAEHRLKAIAAAFSRVEEGRYGICEECGEDIAVGPPQGVALCGLLRRLPVEAKSSVRPGEGDIDEPSRHLWTLPEEWMNRWKNRMR